LTDGQFLDENRGQKEKRASLSDKEKAGSNSIKVVSQNPPASAKLKTGLSSLQLPIRAVCYPWPRINARRGEFCGQLRIPEPGKYWLWLNFVHCDNGVEYVAVRLSTAEPPL